VDVVGYKIQLDHVRKFTDVRGQKHIRKMKVKSGLEKPSFVENVLKFFKLERL